MTRKDIDKALAGQYWANKIVHTIMPFTTKMATPPQFKIYNEVTIRIPTDDKTRFGKDKPQRRRFDSIAVIKPHYKAWGEEILTVGIEIKVSKSDLMNDKKLKEYLGYTNFFFVAVPAELVEDAKQKIGEDKDSIGIIGIQGNRADIIMLSNIKSVKTEHSQQLFQELILKNL